MILTKDQALFLPYTQKKSGQIGPRQRNRKQLLFCTCANQEVHFRVLSPVLGATKWLTAVLGTTRKSHSVSCLQAVFVVRGVVITGLRKAQLSDLVQKAHDINLKFNTDGIYEDGVDEASKLQDGIAFHLLAVVRCDARRFRTSSLLLFRLLCLSSFKTGISVFTEYSGLKVL